MVILDGISTIIKNSFVVVVSGTALLLVSDVPAEALLADEACPVSGKAGRFMLR
jgi:hypothetical protein